MNLLKNISTSDLVKEYKKLYNHYHNVSIFDGVRSCDFRAIQYELQGRGCKITYSVEVVEQ